MSLTYKSSTETTATLGYSASFNLESGAYNKTYSGSIGGTSVSSASGTVIVKSLKQGQANTITGSITCSYKYDVTTTTTTKDEEGNETTTTTTTTHSGSDTVNVGRITVYTHPGAFDMGATSDSNLKYNIIKNVLTVDNIDNWIAHYQKAYHWLNQSNTNYSVDLSVELDEPVSAIWFNKCLTAMNKFPSHNFDMVSGGPNGTIISADIINQLNFAGTGE